MAVVFFDSSAFVKLLVEEGGSDTAARLWDEADAVVASRLARPEVGAALAAARRGGRLEPGDEQSARRAWDEFWDATRVIELTEHLAEVASALAARMVLGGADAVHLASALTLAEVDLVLVTWDRRLSTAAVEAGVMVAPPS